MIGLKRKKSDGSVDGTVFNIFPCNDMLTIKADVSSGTV